MAILTGEKDTIGDQFPRGQVDTAWNRVEPLLTVEQLVARWIFGIPLVSAIKDIFTGKPAVMTKEMVTDIIDRAVTQVEMMAHIEIMPTQVVEKHPLDPQEFKSQGYLRLQHRPVAAVQSVQLVASNDTVLFEFGNDWVDVGQLHQGQLNVIPLLLMMRGGNGTTAIAGTAQSAAYLSVFGGTRWVGSLIQVKYTTGFKDGLIPKILNDLIGITAALMILQMLAPSYGKSQSASLSIDGLSQSTSSAGPNIFTERVTGLLQLQAMMIKKCKTYFGLTLFSGNV